MPSTTVDESVYDLIGLGFGPANLAIAVALSEKWLSSSDTTFPIKKVLFIERHQKFSWHPGMLLPGARMQISFMKDLATLRNPQSPATFMSYLHSQNRLASFINRGSTIPSRKEFSDYLSWAAKFVQDKGVEVMYGHEAIEINKGHNDTIRICSRNLSTGEERVAYTRDIIISPGGAPRVPECLTTISKHPFAIHSSAYVTSISAVIEAFRTEPRPLRVAVIGSGQSAAEVTLDLRSQLCTIPTSNVRHEIDMIIRKGSLKPSDDSPFCNQIFDPSLTDVWFNTPSEQIRELRLAEYKSTNYGVVNPLTLETLFEVTYNQMLDDSISQRTKDAVSSQPHVNIRPYSSIVSTNITDSLSIPGSTEKRIPDTHTSPFIIITQNLISGAVSELKYDIVVYATGYQRSSWVNMLKSSDLGEDYGLRKDSAAVYLLPSSRRSVNRSSDVTFEVNGTSSSSETSPSSSPGNAPLKTPNSVQPSNQIVDTVYISRNYQLLPALSKGSQDEDLSFKPRIYLQGVEEASHGLSDTLLSVVGVRAGEVIADLCKRDVVV